MSTTDDLRVPATLPYFRDHREQLGPVTCAAASIPDPDDARFYLLVVRDNRCGRMRLSGLMPIEEKARADLMQILVEAGFADELARAVLTHDTVRLRRSSTGTTCLELAMNLAAPCPRGGRS